MIRSLVSGLGRVLTAHAQYATGVVIITLLLFLCYAAPVSAEIRPSIGVGGKVVVYYFHGTYRCETCLLIEAVAGQTLTSYFPSRLENGELSWLPVNGDLPEYRRLAEEYGVANNELLVIRYEKGKRLSWENISNVWELAQRPNELVDRLTGSVDRLLRVTEQRALPIMENGLGSVKSMQSPVERERIQP